MSDTTNNETLKIEITQAKILDCLMHGATREDIAELRAETKSSIGELRVEFKADITKLDDKIERIADKMDSKFTIMDGKFNALSDKLDKKLNKYFMWLVGLMFGGFTLMVAGLSTIAVMILNVVKG